MPMTSRGTGLLLATLVLDAASGSFAAPTTVASSADIEARAVPEITARAFSGDQIETREFPKQRLVRRHHKGDPVEVFRTELDLTTSKEEKIGGNDALVVDVIQSIITKYILWHGKHRHWKHCPHHRSDHHGICTCKHKCGHKHEYGDHDHEHEEHEHEHDHDEHEHGDGDDHEGGSEWKEWKKPEHGDDDSGSKQDDPHQPITECPEECSAKNSTMPKPEGPGGEKSPTPDKPSLPPTEQGSDSKGGSGTNCTGTTTPNAEPPESPVEGGKKGTLPSDGPSGNTTSGSEKPPSPESSPSEQVPDSKNDEPKGGPGPNPPTTPPPETPTEGGNKTTLPPEGPSGNTTTGNEEPSPSPSEKSPSNPKDTDSSHKPPVGEQPTEPGGSGEPPKTPGADEKSPESSLENSPDPKGGPSPTVKTPAEAVPPVNAAAASTTPDASGSGEKPPPTPETPGPGTTGGGPGSTDPPKV